MFGKQVASSAIMLNNMLTGATILPGSTIPMNGYSLSSLTNSGRSDRVIWGFIVGGWAGISYDLKSAVRPTAFFVDGILDGPSNSAQRFRQQLDESDIVSEVLIIGADNSAFTSNIVVGAADIYSNGLCIAYLGVDQNPGQYIVTEVELGPLIVNADNTVHVVRVAGTTASTKVMKLNTAGLLDTAYGTAGTYTTGTIGSGSINTNASVNTTAGPVFVGESTAGSSGDMLIYRLLPNTSGTPYVLDTAFNTTGYNTFTQDAATQRHIAYGVCTTETTKHIVGGYATASGGTESFAFTKIHANGTIDTSFGTSGHKLVNGFPSQYGAPKNRCYAVDGVYYIRGAGRVYIGAGQYVAGICQMSSTGTLDAGFGTGGLYEVNLGHTKKNDVALALASRSSTGGAPFYSFFVGGYGNDPASSGSRRGWLAKYNSTVFSGGPTAFNMNAGPIIFNDAFTKQPNIVIKAVYDIVVPSDLHPRVLAVGTECGSPAIFVIKIDGGYGTLTQSFGRLAGIGSHQATLGTIRSAKLFVDASNNMYVSYTSSVSASTYYDSSMIVKFNSNGMEETSWGSGYLSSPKRYWRMEIPNLSISDDQPMSVGNLYLGDYVDIRPDFQTSIAIVDRTKSVSSWNGYQYPDRTTPNSEVSVSSTNISLNEKSAIEDYCRRNGPESFGMLDLLSSEADPGERLDHLFFGNLDSKGGFSSSRKASNLYDVRIKFIEDPK